MWVLSWLSRDDGWAIAKHEGQEYLFRPPYSRGAVAVESAQSAELVSSYFERCDDQVFDDARAITGYLEETVAQARRDCQSAAKFSASTRVLAAADVEDLVRFIKRIQIDYVENGKLDAARRALGAVAEALTEGAEPLALHAYASVSRALLAKERLRSSVLEKIVELEIDYPLASGEFGQEPLQEYVRAVRKRGTLFAFAEAA